MKYMLSAIDFKWTPYSMWDVIWCFTRNVCEQHQNFTVSQIDALGTEYISQNLPLNTAVFTLTLHQWKDDISINLRRSCSLLTEARLFPVAYEQNLRSLCPSIVLPNKRFHVTVTDLSQFTIISFQRCQLDQKMRSPSLVSKWQWLRTNASASAFRETFLSFFHYLARLFLLSHRAQFYSLRFHLQRHFWR